MVLPFAFVGVTFLMDSGVCVCRLKNFKLKNTFVNSGVCSDYETQSKHVIWI